MLSNLQKNTADGDWHPNTTEIAYPGWIRYRCGLGRRFDMGGGSYRLDEFFGCKLKDVILLLIRKVFDLHTYVMCLQRVATTDTESGVTTTAYTEEA